MSYAQPGANQAVGGLQAEELLAARLPLDALAALCELLRRVLRRAELLQQPLLVVAREGTARPWRTTVA